MKSLSNKDRLEHLMKIYLAKEHSRAEAEELFEMLKSVDKPEILEDFFENRWNVEDRPKVNMFWNDVLAARDTKESAITADKNKNRIRSLWKWSIAASLLFLISLQWWDFKNSENFVTYTTDYGETQEILLEDGTEITLNANSELNWSKNWEKEKIRFVQLKGEAFFDVAHVDISTSQKSTNAVQSQLMPFHVQSADMIIEVLGTSFNVEERRGEAKVYLKSGSVKLNFPASESKQESSELKRNQDDTAVSETVLMEAGETVHYSAQTREWVKLETEKTSSITEWKDGILIFDEVRFGDVLQRMEDIYGRSFVVEDAHLLDRPVNFAVPYESWETIEKLMSVSLQLKFDSSGEEKIIIKSRKE